MACGNTSDRTTVPAKWWGRVAAGNEIPGPYSAVVTSGNDPIISAESYRIHSAVMPVQYCRCRTVFRVPHAQGLVRTSEDDHGTSVDIAERDRLDPPRVAGQRVPHR